MEGVASCCVSLLAQRRGYSVVVTTLKGGERSAEHKIAVAANRIMAANKVNTAVPEEKTAWEPDPVTGYSGPAGVAKQVDAAKLRAKLCC